MTEELTGRELALSLGFTDEEAAMLGRAGAPPANIRRVAIGKGLLPDPDRPDVPVPAATATADDAANLATGTGGNAAARELAEAHAEPAETADETADREAAELRADAGLPPTADAANHVDADGETTRETETVAADQVADVAAVFGDMDAEAVAEAVGQPVADEDGDQGSQVADVAGDRGLDVAPHSEASGAADGDESAGQES